EQRCWRIDAGAAWGRGDAVPLAGGAIAVPPLATLVPAISVRPAAGLLGQPRTPLRLPPRHRRTVGVVGGRLPGQPLPHLRNDDAGDAFGIAVRFVAAATDPPAGNDEPRQRDRPLPVPCRCGSARRATSLAPDDRLRDRRDGGLPFATCGRSAALAPGQRLRPLVRAGARHPRPGFLRL